jgi:FkbM family methyltransferase
MKIYYGLNNHIIDVTEICFTQLLNNNIITILSNDMIRSKYFTDPIIGYLKFIYIIKDDTMTAYDSSKIIKIDVTNNDISTLRDDDINDKLKNIHSNLKIVHGSFDEELPEQKMVVRYLSGDEKVLELGSNIGRNSLIIASILQSKNNNNFVTMETDKNTVKKLYENRDLNGFNFHIEDSALSKRQLIQIGWNTITSDVILDGYFKVDTITLEQLYEKYKIDFDTLVLDCEGAIYYILMDMPELLNNIKLIIIENDFNEIEKKDYVDNLLKENGFYIDYSETGGWGPCYFNFFEVWKR